MLFGLVQYMIFGTLVCVFGGLAPMHTPVHASVEDITSHCNACSFLDSSANVFGDGDGTVAPSPVNSPLERTAFSVKLFCFLRILQCCFYD